MVSNNFKSYDKVKHKHEIWEGIIDAITHDKIRVKLPTGYKWVHEWEIELIDKAITAKRVKKIDIKKLDYLG